MKIQIQSVHFSASEQLEDYVEKKVGKLSRFYSEIIDAEVVLTLEKPESVRNKSARVELSVKGENLFAEKTSDSFEDALSHCCEALERQISRFKEKQEGK